MMTMARALTLMASGRLKEGYEAYEVRLDPVMPDAIAIVADGPRWTPDQPLEGKRILAMGEQGVADEFIFANMIPDLIRAVGPEGQVFLAVEPRLVSIFQRSFPGAVVGAHQAVRKAGRLIRFAPFMQEHGAVDGWLPMASLMAPFRPTLEAFPDHAGYMTPDPERVARWRGELAGLGDGFKVGLHWKSLVLKGVRSRYFSPFDQWRPILTTPGCVMVNLQCGDTAAELAQAEAEGLNIWTPPINLKDDLEDVAALSAALDLVIGPGIAGTNIAAAVGANTWMIQAPDDWHLLGTGKILSLLSAHAGLGGGLVRALGRGDGRDGRRTGANIFGGSERRLIAARFTPGQREPRPWPNARKNPTNRISPRLSTRPIWTTRATATSPWRRWMFWTSPRKRATQDDEDLELDDVQALDGVDPHADARLDEGDQPLNEQDAESDGEYGADEIELVPSGLMRNVKGAQGSAAHWESRRLDDDDIDALGYGPDEHPRKEA